MDLNHTIREDQDYFRFRKKGETEWSKWTLCKYCCTYQFAIENLSAPRMVDAVVQKMNSWDRECEFALGGNREIAMEEIRTGGRWLGAVRGWIQSNCRNGSTVIWGSHTTRLEKDFTTYDVEEIARLAVENYILENKKD